jgi:hypothetical protein
MGNRRLVPPRELSKSQLVAAGIGPTCGQVGLVKSPLVNRGKKRVRVYRDDPWAVRKATDVARATAFARSRSGQAAGQSAASTARGGEVIFRRGIRGIRSIPREKYDPRKAAENHRRWLRESPLDDRQLEVLKQLGLFDLIDQDEL